MNQVIQTAPAHPTGRFEDAQQYFSNLDSDIAAKLITAAADELIGIRVASESIGILTALGILNAGQRIGAAQLP